MNKKEVNFSPESRTRLREAYFTVTNLYANKIYSKNREGYWKMLFPKTGSFEEFDRVIEVLEDEKAVKRFKSINKQLSKACNHPYFAHGDDRMARDFNDGFCKDQNVSAFLYLLTLGESKDQSDYESVRDHYLAQLSDLAQSKSRSSNSIFFAELVMDVMAGRLKLKPKKNK